VILAAANKNKNPELLFIFQPPEAFAKAVLKQITGEESRRVVVVRGQGIRSCKYYV
jgi:hypothetical protein